MERGSRQRRRRIFDYGRYRAIRGNRRSGCLKHVVWCRAIERREISGNGGRGGSMVGRIDGLWSEVGMSSLTTNGVIVRVVGV
jgi:hypothetical protein